MSIFTKKQKVEELPKTPRFMDFPCPELIEINQAQTVKLVLYRGDDKVNNYLVCEKIEGEWEIVSSRRNGETGFGAFLARLEMIGDDSYKKNSQFHAYCTRDVKHHE